MLRGRSIHRDHFIADQIYSEVIQFKLRVYEISFPNYLHIHIY